MSRICTHPLLAGARWPHLAEGVRLSLFGCRFLAAAAFPRVDSEFCSGPLHTLVGGYFVSDCTGTYLYAERV